jgi:hypothetical protein
MADSVTPAIPPVSAEGGAREELHAAPPFLTWRAIYAIVLGALALEIAGFAVLTAVCG